MPTTYNGIGTRHYGEKNLQTRPGQCPHCGQMVGLRSYDTRLWFVIVFIPVIPPARKRIVDFCPACTRHHAADAEKWEAAKRLAVSGALDKFKASHTPEAAIETHQALVHYHEFDQAAAFRVKMRHDFAGNAAVHAHLGAVLAHYGQLDEAAQDFLRAHELQPDRPEARIGVAEHHLRNGRPDEARKLLDFLERPGADRLYSLAPLENLARAPRRKPAVVHTRRDATSGKMAAESEKPIANRKQPSAGGQQSPANSK
jgi:tetratricopeptide (TPR) repeat protein